MPARDIDWLIIEREYRAGVLSLREIGRSHGVTEGAVRKRAKRDEWERDLTARVQEAVRTKLVRDAVRKNIREASSDEIVEAASNRNVAAISLHRRDIDALRNRREKLMAQYDTLFSPTADNEPPVRLEMKEVAIAASILESVSRIDEKIVKLERQALNIDAKSSGDQGDEGATSGATERLLGKLDRIVPAAPERTQRLN